MNKTYRPPFTLTTLILKLSEKISREIGRLEGSKMILPTIILRRTNQIKTVHASLAIEGNTLTIEQITDLLNGKRVLGPKKDIVEVKNALALYAHIHEFNPLNIKELLRAHDMLMQNLIDNPGRFRATNVGVFKGTQVAHMAPKAPRIQKLIDDLFVFLKRTEDLSWLLKSCIFHYEFEFIHPFVDGNGRIGRLWQQLLLMKEHHVFAFIPVEEMVRKNQDRYYKTLCKCDQIGESTAFIEFLLEIILEAIVKYGENTEIIPHDPVSRLKYALTYLANKWFDRKDYLAVHKNLSPATASRDLIYGVKHNLLGSVGKYNQVKYKFVQC